MQGFPLETLFRYKDSDAPTFGEWTVGLRASEFGANRNEA